MVQPDHPLVNTTVGTTATTRKSNKKRRSIEKTREGLKKRYKEAQLAVAAHELIKEKENNAGRLPYNAMHKALTVLSTLGVQTTRHVLNKKIQTLKTKHRQPWAEVMIVDALLPSTDTPSNLTPLETTTATLPVSTPLETTSD